MLRQDRRRRTPVGYRCHRPRLGELALGSQVIAVDPDVDAGGVCHLQGSGRALAVCSTSARGAQHQTRKHFRLGQRWLNYSLLSPHSPLAPISGNVGIVGNVMAWIGRGGNVCGNRALPKGRYLNAISILAMTFELAQRGDLGRLRSMRAGRPGASETVCRCCAPWADPTAFRSVHPRRRRWLRPVLFRRHRRDAKRQPPRGRNCLSGPPSALFRRFHGPVGVGRRARRLPAPARAR